MISEIDIKDWERIDVEEVRKAIETTWPIPTPYTLTLMLQLLQKVEALKQVQIASVEKQTAALFRKHYVR